MVYIYIVACSQFYTPHIYTLPCVSHILATVHRSLVMSPTIALPSSRLSIVDTIADLTRGIGETVALARLESADEQDEERQCGSAKEESQG